MFCLYHIISVAFFSSIKWIISFKQWKKSRTREPKHLSTDADSITAAKKLLSIFFYPSSPPSLLPPPRGFYRILRNFLFFPRCRCCRRRRHHQGAFEQKDFFLTPRAQRADALKIVLLLSQHCRLYRYYKNPHHGEFQAFWQLWL